MNNTMKNLKDEIEGIVLALLNTYTLEDEQSEGVDKLALWEAVEALISLIEQEKERAVMGFIDYMYGQNLPLHKAGVVTARAFAKQYLAERKGE